jgi:hypothetical protein
MVGAVLPVDKGEFGGEARAAARGGFQGEAPAQQANALPHPRNPSGAGGRGTGPRIKALAPVLDLNTQHVQSQPDAQS